MSLANIVLVVSVPVIVVVGLQLGGLTAPVFGLVLAGVLGFLGWRRGLAGRVMPVAVGALSIVSLVAGSGFPLRYYPVLVSGAFACGFAWTLKHPPTAIERIARITTPDLPASGVRYTRKVTWLWLGFFLLNGGVALWTAMFGSHFQWLAYNGGISYVLIGLIFAAEWTVRRHVQPPHGEDEKAARPDSSARPDRSF